MNKKAYSWGKTCFPKLECWKFCVKNAGNELPHLGTLASFCIMEVCTLDTWSHGNCMCQSGMKLCILCGDWGSFAFKWRMKRFINGTGRTVAKRFCWLLVIIACWQKVIAFHFEVSRIYLACMYYKIVWYYFSCIFFFHRIVWVHSTWRRKVELIKHSAGICKSWNKIWICIWQKYSATWTIKEHKNVFQAPQRCKLHNLNKLPLCWNSTWSFVSGNQEAVTVFLNNKVLNTTSDLLGGEKRGKLPMSSHRPEVTLTWANLTTWVSRIHGGHACL